MIKARHYFLENVSADSEGIAYQVGDKDPNTEIVISASGATGAALTFYGQVANGEEFVPIKAFKSSDYTLVDEGTVDQAYVIDCASWRAINVEVSGITGGNLTVIGEVIK